MVDVNFVNVYSFTMYAKLFSRITESSLMEEPIPVRYTFVLLLAIADPEGYVIGTDVAIARRLNMELSEFTICISALMEPDENSNSKEEDGRRVILSDHERGYKIVNYVTYRDMKDEEDRRNYMRDYMRKYRGGKLDVNPVNSGKLKLTRLTQAEEEAKEEAKAGSARDVIDSLRNSPAYAGIDLDRELAKMEVWLTTSAGKKRRLTKRFIVNWLNRAEPTLPVATPVQNENRPSYVNGRPVAYDHPSGI